MEMEEGGGGGGSGTHSNSDGEWRWWGLGSGFQSGLGIVMYRKGYNGTSNMMPFKAFTVATLFVGAAATATVAALKASGINKVEDMIEVGANIRSALGAPPRTRD